MLRRLDPVPGERLRLRRFRQRGVRIARRVCGAEGRSAIFADDTFIDVDGVVWAVRYRERTAWMDVPGARDAAGRFVERRGISPARNLHFVGRDWQWTRGSNLLAGVAQDATFVAERILERLSPNELRAAGVVRDATGAIGLSPEGKKLLAALWPLHRWAEGWGRRARHRAHFPQT